MEAKFIDFKESLGIQLGNLNKNNHSNQAKNEDFIKKLNSATKNKESTDKEFNKDIKDVKGSKEIESVEETKKEEKFVYEGMVNLVNLKLIGKEEVEVQCEELEEISLPSVDENQDLAKNAIEEEVIHAVNLQEDGKKLEKSSPHVSKELGLENLSHTVKEETKANLITEKTNKKDINIRTNELDEESSISQEDNLINLKAKTGEETTSKFKEKGQSGERKTGQGYELIDSSSGEKNLEVRNDFFAPFIKDGIEFSNEKPMELEIPIEGKEVVEQIIDQVKFDLSENKNEIKLSLKPDSLGEMTMNVELAKDGIIAKIIVDNYRSKEIIEGNIFQLKEGIKDTGMEIKTFEVFVGNGSDFDQHNSQGFNLQQNKQKLKIKSTNKDEIKIYEDGIIKDKIQLENQILESGLNLLA